MRYLKANKRTELPSHFAALYAATDSEPPEPPSNVIHHPLRQWYAMSWRQERDHCNRVHTATGTEPASCWEWLFRELSPYRPLWVWTHDAPRVLLALQFFRQWKHGNLSLWEPAWRFAERSAQASKAKRRHGLIADSDPPTIVHAWHKSGRQIVIVDTLNWYRESLEVAAQAAGSVTLSMPTSATSAAVWHLYARTQCEAIAAVGRSIYAMVREKDLGCMKYTLPGQAMQHYRHSFMSRKIVLHDEPTVKLLERAAYVGGRIDPFYVGEVIAASDIRALPPTGRKKKPYSRPIGPVYHLDVSNLYPHCMRAHEFPRRLLAYHPTGLPEREWTDARLRCSIAQVLLDSPDEVWPVRGADETLYVKGKIKTTLAGPELVYAKMLGCLHTIEAIATYELADLFSSFVAYWWEERQKPRPPERAVEAQIAKDFLLSFYGKWGEKLHCWQTVTDEQPRQPWGVYFDRDPKTGEYRMCRALIDTLQVRQEPGEAPNAFPAIAAFVTSHARRQMQELRKVAGLRDCYYQGTDSLFVSPQGLCRLQAAGHVKAATLGKLRIVERLNAFTSWGCHDYEKGSTIVRGGISKEVTTAPDGAILQVNHCKLRSALAGVPPDVPLSLTAPIPERQPYTRGKVGRDGWVTPFERNDW